MIIVLFLYLSHYDTKVLRHKRILINAVGTIGTSIIKSHLWLEEYLHGDKKEYSKIDKNINKAKKTIDILTQGGYFKGYYFDNSYNSLEINNKLVNIKNMIEKVKEAKNYRLNQKDIIKSDEKFEENVFYLVDKIERIDAYILKKFNESYTIHSNIKNGIYVFISLLILFGLYLIFIFKKEADEKVKLSLIDELTKVKNRKAYNKEISKLLKKYKRYQSYFSMIMFDIDNFKQINDTYGHDMGDKVLVELSKIVSSNIRKDLDKFFRIGGEEFVILCPEMDIGGTSKLAQKLRLTIKDNLKCIKDREVTVSLGASQIKKEDTIDSIFKRVDEYLYISKNNGKDMLSSDLNDF